MLCDSFFFVIETASLNRVKKDKVCSFFIHVFGILWYSKKYVFIQNNKEYASYIKNIQCKKYIQLIKIATCIQKMDDL